MKLQLGPEIISSYQRLAYQVWYALAEFVDNSTQSYFNNRAALDRVYAKAGTSLTVEIETGKDNRGEFIRITDNSIGMSETELARAVIIGRPPARAGGRSKYGLGLKTGACWFGDLWSVETKKLGEAKSHKITVNVPRIAANHLNLPHKKIGAETGQHYTIVEIRKLHRTITGRSVRKVKNYLRSLYRVDIREKQLVLKWNGTNLEWDSDVDSRIYVLENGRRAKKSFRFKIGDKRVIGWAGVLKNGSRRDAGFSIIQADRVITGWPASYRPETLFGSQEGGSNDLVNQRLFGELFFRGFEVSHTKDQILFDDNDKEILEAKLKSELAGLRRIALTYHKTSDERTRVATDSQRYAALSRVGREIESDPIQDFLKNYELPPDSLVKKSNETLRKAVIKKCTPDLEAKINRVIVSVYLVKEMSPNDPYLLIESTESKTSVIVIINVAHPHWGQLTKDESILNFIRHCTYDGVAEWKCYNKIGTIEPDTVKLIKDNLLRIPMIVQRP